MLINEWYGHIRSRMKLPYNVVKCRLTGVYKPLVVLFYMTDRCNLSCKYCVGNWSARRINDFSLQDIFSVIDQCKALGACHFTIHGGEILLRGDLKQIIDYFKKNKLYVNMVTNGILLPEKIDEITGIDSLCISLDGKEENNDFTRGAGSYKKIMNAINAAKKRRIKFNVHATLTKRTISDIEYLAKQAREVGYYQQFSLLLKPLDPQQSDLGLSDEEIKHVLYLIRKLKKRGYPIFTSYRNLDNAINWPWPYRNARINKDDFSRRKGLIRCFYGKLKVAIDADGFMYPCSSLNDTFKALNVKEVGVKRAYEHILSTNTCEACFYLTQNDWSLLLSGSLKQFFNQAVIQLREIFNIY